MAPSNKNIGIVWFRQDLRLADNPALSEACHECDVIIPLFIADPMEQSVSELGEASCVWLHHSLSDLQASLRTKNSELYLVKGDSLTVLQSIIEKTGANRLFWNRCYDPKTIERDTEIKQILSHCQPRTFNGLLLQEPWQNLKGDGTPYRVYTPYWRAAAAKFHESPDLLKPCKAPRTLPALDKRTSAKLSDLCAVSALELLPDKDWHNALIDYWSVGEAAAMKQLKRFLKNAVSDYGEARNLPAVEGTSLMSPHLHFGEISPRQILSTLTKQCSIQSLPDDETTFAKEIVWREFAYSLLFHFPHMPDKPLDNRFASFPWRKKTEAHLKAWQQGQTGVPIIDAGMRQLYATGWMHNRVRMIVGSYLVKNLLIPWQAGEQWFRDTLVDADLASNSMGWQWVAGCGADAAPFFRVFNPVLQGEKFDKNGDYVSQWVPELAGVNPKFIHKPWELDEQSRQSLEYPEPLVDLKVTRQQALDAFSTIKGTK